MAKISFFRQNLEKMFNFAFQGGVNVRLARKCRVGAEKP